MDQGRRLLLLISISAVISLGAFGTAFALTGQEQPKGSLTEEIVGAWKAERANDDEGDILTFTFNKDNSVTVSQGKHVDGGTYSVTGPDEVTIKVHDRADVKFKIKIAGDTMQMSNARGQTLELKRVK